MGEEFLYVYPLVTVVDNRYQPVAVALDVEDRVRVGKVRSRQHGSYGVDVRKAGLLENLPPTRQLLRRIGVADCTAIQRFLLNDVHCG